MNLKRNWDLILLYLSIVLTILSTTLCKTTCSGMGCIGCVGFIVIGMITILLFSAVSLIRQIIYKMDRPHWWFTIPTSMIMLFIIIFIITTRF